MDLGQTLLCVSEDDWVVELCARVTCPDIECPVTFSFHIGLPPSNYGEGREHQLQDVAIPLFSIFNF